MFGKDLLCYPLAEHKRSGKSDNSIDTFKMKVHSSDDFGSSYVAYQEIVKQVFWQVPQHQ